MKDRINLKILLVALFMVSALAGGTASIFHAAGESLSLPDVAAPEIDDPPNAAELRDLQHIASQDGISPEAAMDRYAWNDNFALSVTRIREAAPASFAGAEIVDAGHAWVAFSGPIPEEAQDIIDTFTNGHSGVSVEVRTGLGFSKVELKRGIEAVHYAVLEAPEVRDATTSFDFATGQITTTVVLESAASDSALDNLRAIAAASLTDATRADIVNSITTTVVRSNQQVLGGLESGTEHLGGEALSPESSTTPHFPLLREEGVVMEAALKGELVLENGCLRVKSVNGAGHLLIWPKRHKLTVDGQDVRIIADSGASLSVGDEIRIGGGERPLRRVQTLVEQPLPDDCPGPYWIVGDIPAQ